MDSASPARLYCLLVGGAFVIGGIIGSFYVANFATGDEIVSDEVFGLIAVNGWHNVVHMGFGAILLIAAGGPARFAAMFFGVLYGVLAVLGFIAVGDGGIGFLASDGALADAIPVNTGDNLLHLATGLAGIAAALASGPRSAATA